MRAAADGEPSAVAADGRHRRGLHTGQAQYFGDCLRIDARQLDRGRAGTVDLVRSGLHQG